MPTRFEQEVVGTIKIRLVMEKNHSSVIFEKCDVLGYGAARSVVDLPGKLMFNLEDPFESGCAVRIRVIFCLGVEKMNQSLVYYQGREAQECELAQGSVDPISRRLHFELAERYAVLAGEARKVQDMSVPEPVVLLEVCELPSVNASPEVRPSATP